MSIYGWQVHALAVRLGRARDGRVRGPRDDGDDGGGAACGRGDRGDQRRRRIPIYIGLCVISRESMVKLILSCLIRVIYHYFALFTTNFVADFTSITIFVVHIFKVFCEVSFPLICGSKRTYTFVLFAHLLFEDFFVIRVGACYS